ncbi:MAG: DUF5325 family protein [Paenibacillaceae bacterium]|uniref:DUF5325 family protein n=1 Tax=Paenibacillus cymbidii TaxID=1639034 RepID=UPI001081B159|nr:DUF5325 family protein [Paenibacillus cymbidii]MBO9605403.1 DUF5325 family protein [Paenibacillaceae bacterium]
MKPIPALLFALLGIALLTCVSFFMSAGEPWLAALSGLAAFLAIGFGFAFKARVRRKGNS